MRKEVAAPRRLPPKGLAQRRRLHGQQYQAVLAGPVLGGAGLDLVGAGKVDEAVGAVLRRALVAAGRLGRRPLFAPADMINHAGHDPNISDPADRKSVVKGKSVSGRVYLGGSRVIKKKKKEKNERIQ